MRRTGWLIAIVLVAGLCWFFPLFHIVPLERATKEKAAATFDPKEFAGKFWNEQLLTSLHKAVKAEVLLPAIQADASGAKRKFSRSVGVSESYTYFVSGKGRVMEVSSDEISLAITEGATKAEVSLQAGLLFGNAVRDGTGLLNVNDYPNSQDFNGISEALNRIIEERVQPKLRAEAKVGAIIRFVGCAEVNDEAVDLKPLKVVPIQTVVE
jgi:predicted lipoprotein